MLHRTLMASPRSSVGRSRRSVTGGVQNRGTFLVSGFIEEIASAATLEANARGVILPPCPSKTAWRSRPTDKSWPRSWKSSAERLQVHPPSDDRDAQVGASASACSSRSRTSAAVCRAGMSTSSFARSNSAAPIAPAWVLVSPSADGALRRTMAASMRATFLVGDVFLPSTCRGSQFPSSRWCSHETPRAKRVNCTAGGASYAVGS